MFHVSNIVFVIFLHGEPRSKSCHRAVAWSWKSVRTRDGYSYLYIDIYIYSWVGWNYLEGVLECCIYFNCCYKRTYFLTSFFLGAYNIGHEQSRCDWLASCGAPQLLVVLWGSMVGIIRWSLRKSFILSFYWHSKKTLLGKTTICS